jgi:hypothetical protein
MGALGAGLAVARLLVSGRILLIALIFGLIFSLFEWWRPHGRLRVRICGVTYWALVIYAAINISSDERSRPH